MRHVLCTPQGTRRPPTCSHLKTPPFLSAVPSLLTLQLPHCRFLGSALREAPESKPLTQAPLPGELGLEQGSPFPATRQAHPTEMKMPPGPWSCICTYQSSRGGGHKETQCPEGPRPGLLRSHSPEVGYIGSPDNPSIYLAKSAGQPFAKDLERPATLGTYKVSLEDKQGNFPAHQSPSKPLPHVHLHWASWCSLGAGRGREGNPGNRGPFLRLHEGWVNKAHAYNPSTFGGRGGRTT